MAPIGAEFPSVLDAARTGAEWAWQTIYRELAPAVLGYLRNSGAHSPEDVCGDVFCELVRDLHRFEGSEEAFRGWVFLIARHRLIDEQRRRSRRPEVVLPSSDLQSWCSDADTESEALDNYATDEVRKILAVLTPPQRDVLLLRVVAGLSVDDVATITGKRPGAVRALQHRAVEVLREKLGSRNAIGVLSGS